MPVNRRQSRNDSMRLSLPALIILALTFLPLAHSEPIRGSSDNGYTGLKSTIQGGFVVTGGGSRSFTPDPKTSSFAQGRHWLFYLNSRCLIDGVGDACVFFSSSSDDTTWTLATNTTFPSLGFALAGNSTHVFLANPTGSALLFRYGLLTTSVSSV